MNSGEVADTVRGGIDEERHPSLPDLEDYKRAPIKL
jgi:hypothetical protein